MLVVLIVGDAFCVGKILGACRRMKERDKNDRNYRSSTTFPKLLFGVFFKLPPTFTLGEFLEK